MGRVKLTETDLKYMIRKAINEIMSYEGKEDTGELERNKYYFRTGWDRTYGGDNQFTAEGPIGGNFDALVSQIQEYTDKKIQEFEKRRGRYGNGTDNWFKNRINNELKIAIEMPKGEDGWKRYAYTKIDSEVVKIQINPENVEESVRKAWSIFNTYAKNTPEVIGWYLWKWSEFPPTIWPILKPEIGQEITGEGDKIRDYYDKSKYTGD